MIIVALTLACSHPAVGPLFSVLLHPLCPLLSVLFHSGACWGCWGLLVVLVCPSRPARRSLSWRTVRLCTACSLTCCAWFAGLTSLLARRRPAQVINLSVDTSVLLLFCFGLWVAIPPKLVEQRSTLLLTCSHRWFSTQTRLYWSTGQHVWWSLAPQALLAVRSRLSS